MATASTSTGGRTRARSSSLALVVNHRLRARIWYVLRDRVASPNQLKELLGVKLSDAAYHVRVLAKHGCIELVDTKQRRGATEHFYRAIERPDFDAEQIGELSVEQAQENALSILQMGFADAARALEGKTLCSRKEHFVARLVARVDAEAFSEISFAFDEFLERFYAADAASAERMRRDPTLDGIPVTGLGVFGEMPGQD